MVDYFIINIILLTMSRKSISKITWDYVKNIYLFEEIMGEMKQCVKDSLKFKTNFSVAYKNFIALSKRAFALIFRMKNFINLLKKSWEEVDEETKVTLVNAVKKYNKKEIADPNEAIDVITKKLKKMKRDASWLKEQAKELYPEANNDSLDIFYLGKHHQN